jgi:hypothetical protein
MAAAGERRVPIADPGKLEGSQGNSRASRSCGCWARLARLPACACFSGRSRKLRQEWSLTRGRSRR